MTITLQDFEYVVELARGEVGLQLSPDQQYLVETRLSALIYREGIDSVETLMSRLRADGAGGEIRRKVIESLVTTETYFFRDVNPFEALKNAVLPSLMANRESAKRITFWSGASSTGQEPFSIAMLLKERFDHLKDWSFRIIATDISEENLEKGRAGRFSELQMGRGLAPELREKYFFPVGREWEVQEDLKRMIEFRKLNLLEPFGSLKADVVFLRNVLIYFDVETKRQIFSKIRAFLPPDGALFLGSCETTVAIDPAWEPVYADNTVFFRPKPL